MNKKKVYQNSIVGMLANGTYLMSRLILTPLILLHVSLEEFGLWSFCFVIISFAGLSGTGIGATFIKFTAEFHSRGEDEKINEIFSTCTLLLAFFSLIIFSGVWFFTPLLLEIFGINNTELRELAIFLIRGSVMIFLFDLTLSGFKSLLEGLQEIALVRIVWLGSTILESILTVVLLTLGWGIESVLWAYAFRCLTGFLAYFFLALRKLNIRIRFSLEALRLIYSFGGKMQILNFIGIFMMSFDRLVVTKILGLDFTGIFEIGRKFPVMGAGVTGAAFDSFFPASSAARKENRFAPPNRQQWKRYCQVSLLALVLGGAVGVAWPIHEWNKVKFAFTDPFILAMLFFSLVVICFFLHSLSKQLITTDDNHDVFDETVKKLYLEGNFSLNLFNAVIFSFLATCSPKLILAWVGPGYEEAAWVMTIFSLSVLVNLSTGTGSAILRGAGRLDCELEYSLLNLILALLWIPIFTHFLELPGAALGTAASTIIASLYFNARASRIMGISMMEYLEEAFLPALVPIAGSVFAGVGLFFLNAESRGDALLQVLVIGSIYLIYNFFLLTNLSLLSKELKPVEERIRSFKNASWR